MRVLHTQEVGYIPAENIESPFERLARLNKHRNVDLSSATNADQVQVQDNVHKSYLVKSREQRVTLLPSSGKRSALSRRLDGSVPTVLGNRRKSAVAFGNSTILELSDHEEWSENDEQGDYYDDDDDDEAEEEEEERQDEVREDTQASHTGPEASQDYPSPESRLALQHQQQQQHDAYARQQGQFAVSSHEQDTRTQVSDARLQHSSVQQQSQVRPGGQYEGPTPIQAQQYYAAQQGEQQRALQPQQHRQEMEQQAQQVQQYQQQVQQQVQERQTQLQQRDQRSSLGLSGQPFAGSRHSASPEIRVYSPTQDTSMRSHESAGSPPSDAGSNSPSGGEKQPKKRSSVFGIFSRHKKDRASPSLQSNEAISDDSGVRSSSGLGAGMALPPELAFSSPSAEDVRPSRDSRVSMQPDTGRLSIYGDNFASGSALPASVSGYNLGSGRPRPGSLIMPGGDASVPMLNVLRVFAGADLETGFTYKTVLLNEVTTANEIVKQAVQRFGIRRRSTQSTATGERPILSIDNEFALQVRVVDGEERILAPEEVPVKVYEHIAEQNANALMPAVRRSSVGSISSVTSNLSAKSAITKLNHDFSDDHAVKFFLTRRNQPVVSGSSLAPVASMASTAASDADLPTRFGIRVLIFPNELPRSLAFDPSSLTIVRRSMLAGISRHNSTGSGYGNGDINQAYREKVLAVPRSATVAEVIELALEKFGIPQGVAEGGDEEDTGKRENGDEVTIPYGLTADIDRTEHPLRPNSAVYDAFDSPPLLRSVPRDWSSSDRRSLDSSTMLHLLADMRSTDPVFILRQQQHIYGTLSAPISRTARAWSPTEKALASKRDARRKSQLDLVRTAPDPSALREIESEAVTPSIDGMSAVIPTTDLSGTTSRSSQPESSPTEQVRRHEMIAAQRAKARALALEAARKGRGGNTATPATSDSRQLAQSPSAAPEVEMDPSQGEQRPSFDSASPANPDVAVEHDEEEPDAIDAILNHVMQGGDGESETSSLVRSPEDNLFPSIAAVATGQGADDSPEGQYAANHLTATLQPVQPLHPRRSPPSTSTRTVSDFKKPESPVSALDAPGAWVSTPSSATPTLATPAPVADERTGPGAGPGENHRSAPNVVRLASPSHRPESYDHGSESVSPNSTLSPVGGQNAPGPQSTGPLVHANGRLGSLSLDHLYALMDAAAVPRNTGKDGRGSAASVSGGWLTWPDAQLVRAEEALQLRDRSLLIPLFARPTSLSSPKPARYTEMEHQLAQVGQTLDQLLVDALRLPS